MDVAAAGLLGMPTPAIIGPSVDATGTSAFQQALGALVGVASRAVQGPSVLARPPVATGMTGPTISAGSLAVFAAGPVSTVPDIAGDAQPAGGAAVLPQANGADAPEPGLLGPQPALSLDREAKSVRVASPEPAEPAVAAATFTKATANPLPRGGDVPTTAITDGQPATSTIRRKVAVSLPTPPDDAPCATAIIAPPALVIAVPVPAQIAASEPASTQKSAVAGPRGVDRSTSGVPVRHAAPDLTGDVPENTAPKGGFADRIDVRAAVSPDGPLSRVQSTNLPAAALPAAALPATSPTPASAPATLPALDPAPPLVVSRAGRPTPPVAAPIDTAGYPDPATMLPTRAVAAASGNTPVAVAAQPTPPVAPPPHAETIAVADDVPVEPVGQAAPLPTAGPAAAERSMANALPAPISAHTVPLPYRATHFATDTGAAIARHIANSGDPLTLRIDPPELGRVEVRMSYEDGGRLRAVVGSDNAAVLTLLSRDVGELVRAVSDAGVNADQRSFRFEANTGDGNPARMSSDGGNQPRDQRQPQGRVPDPRGPAEDNNPTIFKPLRWRGQIDVAA